MPRRVSPGLSSAFFFLCLVLGSIGLAFSSAIAIQMSVLKTAGKCLTRLQTVGNLIFCTELLLCIPFLGMKVVSLWREEIKHSLGLHSGSFPIAHGMLDVSRLPNQLAKQQCQPRGHVVLLQAQIRPANVFSYFIFLELEIKIILVNTNT